MRFQAPVESEFHFLAIELIDPVVEENALLQSQSQTEQGLAGDDVDISRAAWGARSRNCGSAHTPNRLTVHHTYIPNNDSLSMAARVRQIQAYHIDNKGWCDSGYHFLVGQDGEVYQGRYENRTGAHAGGANRDNVGVSYNGNFTDAPPSARMFRAGANILRALADEWSIPLDRDHVKGHREVGTTGNSCPGDAFFPILGDLVQMARGDVNAPAPPPPAASCQLTSRRP
ncbi:MAG: hypothetical protein GY822_29065 [Deltaproteobacteria bacterium]|nr:hypothetical protein [Deltaproteobacteria bacterium]